MSAEAKTSLLSNKAYDVAKDATQIWLPALAALYSAIAIVWGLPFHALGMQNRKRFTTASLS